MTPYASISETTTTIGRIRAQYRLRPSQFDAKDRLDGLLRQVTGEALELALDRFAVNTREVICIRSIFVPIRLGLARSDSALIADWALELAERIGDAASGSNSETATAADSIVRYSSSSRALLEMGIALAQGRSHLLWAWRQMGFWTSTSDSPSESTGALEFAGALTREPDGGLAVLVNLAQQGWLRPLLLPMEDKWVVVVAAVLKAAGVSEGLASPGRPNWPYPGSTLNRMSFSSDFSDTNEQPASGRIGPIGQATLANLVQRAANEAQQSRILEACRGLRLSPAAAMALATLGLLERNPSLVRAHSEDLIASVDAVYKLVFASQKSLSQTRPAEADLLANLRPAKNLESDSVHRPEGPDHRQDTNDLDRRDRIDPMAPKAGSDRADRGVSAELESVTRFGGLLFLIRLMEALRIPERLLRYQELSARSFPWFLHSLALELQPLAPQDPAALAFCGLNPAANHPSLDQPAPTSEEHEFIESLATEIRRELAGLLPGLDRSPESSMPFVCRRHAHISFDPGWIEAQFLLQDVSVDIRRAGLDLNPNYVPWLGVVVRFVYA